MLGERAGQGQGLPENMWDTINCKREFYLFKLNLLSLFTSCVTSPSKDGMKCVFISLKKTTTASRYRDFYGKMFFV